MIFKKVKKWWQSLRYYVIADPADNSVTLSKALFNHIKNEAFGSDEARVFVFKITDSGCFGFMTNPSIEQPTVCWANLIYIRIKCFTVRQIIRFRMPYRAG